MKLQHILLLSIFLSGCAVTKPDYSSSAKKWKEKTILPDEQAELDFKLFLLGDAGDSESEISRNTLKLLEEKIDKKNPREGVIFLGDNIYPYGMPDSSHKDFPHAAAMLDSQLSVLRNYRGIIQYLPGEHDWKEYGHKSLERQDDFIEAVLNRKKIFEPDQGCAGPADIDLGENLRLIIIDSQWYLEDWDENDDFNEGCDIKDRAAFIDELADELGKSRDKRVLLLMHHPLRSYGPHGGQNSFFNTVFPFRNDNKPNIPIPFLSTFLRKHSGLRQDINNPKYREFIDKIQGMLRGMDNVVLIGAHDHSLQYIEDTEQKYIISGAASKGTPANAGGFAKYTSGQGGFAEVRVYKDQSAWVYFWNSKSGKLDYATRILPPRLPLDLEFDEYHNLGDSVSRPLFTEDRYPSDLHISLWGDLHRSIYYDTITAPVLRLDDMEISYRPVRRGGGNQTRSMQLTDNYGQTYALRSVVKYGERLMGGAFKGTIVVNLLEDLYTFGHPFGAFTLPPIAEAANIYHTKPKLVYIPKQPALEGFNDEFGGEFYLLEKRADEDVSEVKEFGNSKNVENWQNTLEALEESYKNIVDQKLTARTRIFDIMVGDWDRHQDNWRFATFPIDSNGEEYTLYSPIPRDRDMVYSKFDGPILKIFNYTIPRGRQFQSYAPEIDRIEWYGEFPKFYDRRFVGPIEWKVWEKEVKRIQENVSDSVIEYGVRLMPESAFKISGEEIISIMKARRNNMMELARSFYLTLAENVDLVGTEEDDRFVIERLNNDSTLIRIYGKSVNDEEHLVYERYFLTHETDEVRIYGLGGDDIFEVNGKVKKGILLRLIGGYDDDKVEDNSKVSGLFNKTLVYDRPKGMDIEEEGEVSDRRSERYDFNNYEFKDYSMDYGLLLPYLGYDPDFGLRAGLTYTYYNYGFKQRPTASTHNLSAIYAFGNSSLALDYNVRFNNIINYWGVLLNTTYHGAQFTINYFGTGNESFNDQEREREYYQVQQGQFYISPGLFRPIGHEAGYFSIQPFYQRLKTQEDTGRFVGEFPFSDVNGQSVFEPAQFYGALSNFQYDTRNSFAEPTQGMLNNIRLKYSRGIETKTEYVSMKGTLAFYQSIDPYKSLVWAMQVGGEHLIGEYLFYQTAYVGGQTSIRGYREGRFRGRSSFWNSNDLRLDLGKVKNPIIPMNAGIFGSFDFGRVWADGQNSDRWHSSYGGGVFLNLFDLMAVTISYHKGSEDGQILGGLGFSF